jgi:pimeloyl-ACP methyl ester carboxylesterase
MAARLSPFPVGRKASGDKESHMGHVEIWGAALLLSSALCGSASTHQIFDAARSGNVSEVREANYEALSRDRSRSHSLVRAVRALGADLRIDGGLRAPDGGWLPAVPLTSLNTPGHEVSPRLSPDGKYLFFLHRFNGGLRPFWVSTTVITDLRPGSITAPAAAQFRAVNVVIPSHEGRILAGTLTLPTAGTPPYPAALTITGSGPHFRDGNRTPDDPYRPFRQIAAALATHGVATLRLDDRGVGGSTGDAAATTGDDVADDMRVAVAWLRTRSNIASERIALIGHSFGGAVAPMVAAKDSTIAAMVLMGAPAKSFREIMRYQNLYRIARDTIIPPAGRSAAVEAAMRWHDSYVATSPEKWMSWAQDRDPLPTVRRVRCPVLIAQGLTDRAVPPDDAKQLAAALREGGNTHVTVHEFTELNHHFQRDSVGATDAYYDLPTQDLAPEFLDVVSEWLARALGVPRASALAPTPSEPSPLAEGLQRLPELQHPVSSRREIRVSGYICQEMCR